MILIWRNARKKQDSFDGFYFGFDFFMCIYIFFFCLFGMSASVRYKKKFHNFFFWRNYLKMIKFLKLKFQDAFWLRRFSVDLNSWIETGFIFSIPLFNGFQYWNLIKKKERKRDKLANDELLKFITAIWYLYRRYHCQQQINTGLFLKMRKTTPTPRYCHYHYYGYILSVNISNCCQGDYIRKKQNLK